MTPLSHSFDYCWKPFDALTPLEVYAILAARSDVFVVEQKCVYADVDGLDIGAWHLMALSGDALAGYLRVLLPHENDVALNDTDLRIGRVLTTRAFRGKGVGQHMLERTLTHIADQWPGRAVRLHAQAHLQRFYGAFGFEAISEVHDEDDIPHIWMRLGGAV